MAKPEHWRGKTPVRCIKTAFFLNWVEHAILEVHSHSNCSQNFASFSKNPPEKKNCRKRSVKKLFISSLKKGWSVAKTFLLGKCISLFIDGVLVFKVSKVWGLVPSSLIHELIVHQGSYTFLRVEEPHFALVWKGVVTSVIWFQNFQFGFLALLLRLATF